MSIEMTTNAVGLLDHQEKYSTVVLAKCDRVETGSIKECGVAKREVYQIGLLVWNN